jgi:hypothetical protein
VNSPSSVTVKHSVLLGYSGFFFPFDHENIPASAYHRLFEARCPPLSRYLRLTTDSQETGDLAHLQRGIIIHGIGLQIESM